MNGPHSVGTNELGFFMLVNQDGNRRVVGTKQKPQLFKKPNISGRQKTVNSGRGRAGAGGGGGCCILGNQNQM